MWTEGWPQREEVVERAPVPPPEPPPARRGPNLGPPLLALLVLVLAGLGAAWALSRNEDEPRAASPPQAGVPATGGTTTGAREATTSTAPARMPVPKVVGHTIAKAVERLGATGFEVRQRGVYSMEPPGTIVAQEPAGGERAERGAEVRINYSRGQNRVPVPDVLGRSEAEAAVLLERAGLDARPFEVPSPEPKGVIVAQNPQPGAKARRGRGVRINVSAGATEEEAGGGGTSPRAEPASLPDAVGLPLRTAQRELLDLELVVRVVYVGALVTE